MTTRLKLFTLVMLGANACELGSARFDGIYWCEAGYSEASCNDGSRRQADDYYQTRTGLVSVDSTNNGTIVFSMEALQLIGGKVLTGERSSRNFSLSAVTRWSDASCTNHTLELVTTLNGEFTDDLGIRSGIYVSSEEVVQGCGIDDYTLICEETWTMTCMRLGSSTSNRSPDMGNWGYVPFEQPSSVY